MSGQAFDPAPKDNNTHIVEFNRSALVRADMSARGEFFAKALGGAPWMTRDEVRGIDNLNPLPNGVGEQLVDPLNICLLYTSDAADE